MSAGLSNGNTLGSPMEQVKYIYFDTKLQAQQILLVLDNLSSHLSGTLGD